MVSHYRSGPSPLVCVYTLLICGQFRNRALEKRLRTFLAEHWRRNDVNLLFCNSKGKPMQRDKVSYKRQATLESLGIEKAALHAFRHMAASELLEQGASPSVVQRRMRHSDSRITLQK